MTHIITTGQGPGKLSQDRGLAPSYVVPNPGARAPAARTSPPPGWIAPTSLGDIQTSAAAAGLGHARCMPCRRCSADTSLPISGCLAPSPKRTRHSEARPVPKLQNSRFWISATNRTVIAHGVPNGYGCVSRLAAVTRGDRLRKKTFIVFGGAEKGSRIVAAWPSGQWAGAGYLADDPAEF